MVRCGARLGGWVECVAGLGCVRKQGGVGEKKGRAERVVGRKVKKRSQLE